MLKGGDGAGGVGKGGLEMGEDVGCGPVFLREMGRRAKPQECRAQGALAAAEPLPDAAPGAVAAMAAAAAASGAEAVGDGAAEEAVQAGGGQAEAADFIGEPDGDGPAAAGACVAVAAKEAVRAAGHAWGGFVKAVQRAVANESADDLAVGTGGELEPLDDGVPIVVVAAEPAMRCHGDPSSNSAIVPGRGRRGVAGYERDGDSGVRGIPAVPVVPNSRCQHPPSIGWYLGTIPPENAMGAR